MNAIKLTEREREIVDMLAQGLSRAEIARRLCRSPKTVDFHRNAAMKKLDARTEVQLGMRLAQC